MLIRKRIPSFANITRFWRCRGGLVVWLAWVCVAGAGLERTQGQDLAADPSPEKVEWRTGPDFRRQLQATVGVNWKQNPLRSAVENLSGNMQVAIFLDRRVDPGQPVDFAVPEIPLEDLLARLARQLDLGVSCVGPIVYIGPAEDVSKLATLVELRRDELRSAAPEVRRTLIRHRPLAWPQLATPRQILKHLGSRWSVSFTNADRMIPHDLWPSASLPPCGFVEQATLVLAGFGMTFELAADGQSAMIVPLPKTVSITREYKAPGNAEAIARQLAENFPEARFRVAGGEIEMTGRMEDHTLVRRLLAGEKVVRKRVERDTIRLKRYSLTQQNVPAGAIVRTLSQQPELDVEFDPAVVDTLRKPISVDVKEATIDELLHAVLDPLGLAFERDDGSVRIYRE